MVEFSATIESATFETAAQMVEPVVYIIEAVVQAAETKYSDYPLEGRKDY